VSDDARIQDWTAQIEKEIHDNLVFVYAKGEKNMAVCGFSHRVMEIFNRLGVDYQVRNVLADPAIRQAVCAHTDWPTIPQIFIGGKFVGGCDIVTEMYESGELQEAIDKAKRERTGSPA
jgi:monothiol glutaredoxin